MKLSPKEKAKELVEKVSLYSERCVDQLGQYDYKKSKGAAIQCALIDVGNTLFVLSNIKATTEILKEYRFWFEVKIELEKS